MPRLKLTLAYEGTRYSGWQMQEKKGCRAPGKAMPNMAAPHMTSAAQPREIPTIQSAIESAVSGITGCRCPAHGAGRTDAGVHAEAQVCHIDIRENESRTDPLKVDWKRALNVALPEDIRVTAAEWVPGSFHSRRDATGKLYAYSLWYGRDKALPRLAPFVWSVPELNFSRLEEAAARLPGKRDFASFRNSGADLRTTVRTLRAVRLTHGVAGPFTCPPEWPVATLEFEGDGFLKQMVRNLTGLLVWVGLGKTDLADIDEIFASCDRRALKSPSAPAQGLTLMRVFYE